MKNKTELMKEYSEALLERYQRYNHILLHGSDDYLWEDGTAMYLVRNHIMYYKEKIESLEMDCVHYPDCYFFPLPKKVSMNYNCVSRKNGKGLLIKTEEYEISEMYEEIDYA